MKKVKIGKTEYSRIENIFDIGDERFTVFKQWILQIYENVDKPSFLEMHSRIVKHFNSSDNYKVMVELENYKQAVVRKDANYDAISFCFALLHIEQGELQCDTGSDTQLKKLEKMRKEADGELSRGLMEEVVENFTKGSPKHFKLYLETQEAMKLLTRDEILNALES